MNDEEDRQMERWLTEIEIREGMARTLWVLAWTEYEQSQGRTYPGQDIYEIAPDTPADADDAARRVIMDIEYRAYKQGFPHGTDIVDLYEMSKESATDNPLQFGYVLAHMTQGTGVSWTDDHEKELPFRVPSTLVVLDDLAAEMDPHARPQSDDDDQQQISNPVQAPQTANSGRARVTAAIPAGRAETARTGTGPANSPEKAGQHNAGERPIEPTMVDAPQQRARRGNRRRR